MHAILLELYLVSDLWICQCLKVCVVAFISLLLMEIYVRGYIIGLGYYVI